MNKAKLNRGDKICVIAPSRSLKIVSEAAIKQSLLVFNKMGLEVVFGKHVYEIDEFNSSSVESRLEDLHEAFLDPTIKGIFTAIGGFNSNQLLDKLNYNLIKQNPKVLCGFSDITALNNAIYTQTGLITYSGPHFSSFAMEKGIEYTIKFFKKCLMDTETFSITHSDTWSDDKWFLNQEDRIFIKNSGPIVVNHGKAVGTLLGGNLCTLNLLQGSKYMPNITNSILCIEDDELKGSDSIFEFDRDLQSLIHLKNFDKVKGILIGRFQNNSEISDNQIFELVKSKTELDNIPVITNINFGHTTPIVTLPIGGTVLIEATTEHCKIEFLNF